MTPRSAAIVMVAFVMSACSGSDSSPTAPSAAGTSSAAPVLTSVTIGTTSNFLVLGSDIATLTVTGRYSNGTTRSEIATFESSNPDVISVSTSNGLGTARPQRAGVVTITGRAGSQSATVSIRAIPDFSGNWSAQVRHTQCSPPVRWGSSFCGPNPNALTTATLRLSRTTGDGVTGSYQYTSPNGNVWNGTVSGAVSNDGVLMMTGRLDSPRPQINFYYYSDVVDWRATLSPSLGLIGTYSEIVTLVGERETAFQASEIVRATR